MTDDAPTTDRSAASDGAGHAFAPPAFAPPAAAPSAYATGASAPQPTPQASPVPVAHEWTADGLASTPALPPERVGRGAALALLAIPAGALVAGVFDALGFISMLSGFVTAVLAAVLYARGSGGRVKKGIPVIIGVILAGVAASFFTVVAVDLWKAFPTLDADVIASYASRWDFVTANLFYPPVLASDAHALGVLVLFSALGAVATIVRLVKVSHQH